MKNACTTYRTKVGDIESTSIHNGEEEEEGVDDDGDDGGGGGSNDEILSSSKFSIKNFPKIVFGDAQSRIGETS